MCGNTIINSQFINNTAEEKGGAINYNLRRPNLAFNYYDSNIAPYGENLASYSYRIVNASDIDMPILFSNIGSGIIIDIFELAIVDYDNQTMTLDNSSLIKISAVTNGASVIGFDSYPVINGIATFIKTGFVFKPGATNVSYKANSNNISEKFLQQIQMPYENNITVDFRL